MANQSRTRKAVVAITQAIPKERMLALIAEGYTLRRIAALATVETGKEYSSYYISRVLKTYGEDYEEAKRLQALHHADRLGEIAEEVEQGKLDPASARVSSDNRKWLAARGDPRQYGDKIQADIQVTDMTALHMEALRQKLAAKTVQARVIERGEESSD